MDLFCAKYVDKIGYRRSVVASEILSAVGLIGLAFYLILLNHAYVGILISVIIYAMGSGLIEVLVSPIVEACPFDNKESVMSLLHSFFLLLGSRCSHSIFNCFLYNIWNKQLADSCMHLGINSYMQCIQFSYLPDRIPDRGWTRSQHPSIMQYTYLLGCSRADGMRGCKRDFYGAMGICLYRIRIRSV